MNNAIPKIALICDEKICQEIYEHEDTRLRHRAGAEAAK